MRRKGLVALAAAVAALAFAVPAHAQSWRGDIGINGGGSYYTPLLSNSEFGGNGDAVKFKPNWLLGTQLGMWFTPRIGLRANGTYTDTKLRQGSVDLINDVNLWSASGDLMFRFKAPAETFTKMEMLPYLALGVGAKFINPAGENFTESTTGKTGSPFYCLNGTCATTGVVPTAADNFFLAKATRLMGLVGIGTDLRVARNFAIRLEAGDRIYKPKVYALNTVTGAFPATVTATTGDNVAKLVNEIYGQVGLHLLFGLAAPPVVAVTPTPAPPPPAPPPPAPTTATTSVCVVDPTAATGLRTETATVTLATNDTTVMLNGTETPLRTAYTSVPVAANAPWYVQGQPLTIGTGRNALAYVSFGTARNIDMGDLAYVGTVNGLPVYANKTDVTTLTIPSPAVDITTNPTLMTGLRNVQVLYVPVTAYGCNFQPIQLQQAVRKVRG